MRKPNMMMELVKTTGAKVVNYGLERLCCGYPTMQADEEFSLKNRLLPKLKGIERAEADAIVLVCPACIVQFEMGQMLLRRFGANYRFPCISIIELMALSMGIPSRELRLEFHRSPVSQMARKMEVK